MVTTTKPPSGRISDPPYTIQEYDPESFKYLNDLVRELEIAFRDVIQFSTQTNNTLTSVSTNTTLILAAIASISQRVSIANVNIQTNATNIATQSGRITSVNNRTANTSARLTSISAVLENRISAVSALAGSGGGSNHLGIMSRISLGF